MNNHSMHNKYLKISEIAKTCGVTKHTLLHYDDIGLLKPEFINEKGYRFYSVKQCYTLDIINLLKRAGSSLKEIGEFIQNQNKMKFKQIIQQNKRDLELEMLRMKRVDHFLECALNALETNEEFKTDTPFIEEYEEQYFVVTQVKKQEEHEYAKTLTKHRAFCENHLIAHEFPVWSIITKESFESSQYFPDFIASKLTKPSKLNTVIKPKGRYVVMIHRGFYDTMAANTYTRIKKYIEENNLKVIGDTYEEEMLNYYTEQNEDNFVIRVSVAIE